MLEEAVVAARATDGDEAKVWDVRRRFQSIADALTAVGAVPEPRAHGIVRELDDALAVRGLVKPSAFAFGGGPGHGTLIAGTATPTTPATTQTPTPTATKPGDGWLEAQIEHHLDLVVDLRPKDHPDVADQVLANLAPQVRALRAAGAIRSGRRLDDLAMTFEAAGYAVDQSQHQHGHQHQPGRGDVDRGWLSFLRARPEPLRTDHDATHHRDLDVDLGHIDRQPVRLRRLGWSTDVLELDVDAPAIAGAWHASAFDDSGQLHVGQPGQLRGIAPSPLVFRLRPGIRDGVRSLSVRVTFGATRLDERATL